MLNQKNIKNLNERINFWNKHYMTTCQGCTPINENLIQEYCKNKEILEIGPGEGRQFEIAFPISKNYSIADISEKVLNNILYKKCKNKFLIKDYNSNFDNNTFNLIHCWYVIHHILREETEDFIKMIYRHLKPGGIFLFNYPDINIKIGNFNDGKKTTRRNYKEIKDILIKSNFEIFKFKSNTKASMNIVSIKNN